MIILTFNMTEEVVVVKKRSANAAWNKESNGFLVSEVLTGYPTCMAN